MSATLSSVYPTLFHIGHLSLPTYGLLVALGLIAALNLSLRTGPRVGLSPEICWDFGVFAVVSAFVLSRLLLVAFFFHSFVSYPILLLTLPSLTPLGILLTGFASLAYLRSKRVPLRPALDAWAPPLTLFWAFLALGHFAGGSDPGLPTTSPLALRIPPDPTRLHPVALYVTLCALAITGLLLQTLPRTAAPVSPVNPLAGAASQDPSSRLPATAPAFSHSPHAQRAAGGVTASLGLALAGLTEFLLSFLRQPGPIGPAFAALLDPLQWLSLGFIAAAALMYLTREPSSQRPLPHAV